MWTEKLGRPWRTVVLVPIANDVAHQFSERLHAGIPRIEGFIGSRSPLVCLENCIEHEFPDGKQIWIVFIFEAILAPLMRLLSSLVNESDQNALGAGSSRELLLSDEVIGGRAKAVLAKKINKVVENT